MAIRTGPVSSTDLEYCNRDIEFTFAQMKVQLDGNKMAYDSKIARPNISCVEMRHLATDLAFLTGLSVTDVLYIGTETLRHLPALASLFPKIHFHVYYPSSSGLLQTDNITYKGASFDQKALAEWNSRDAKSLAIISDARMSKIAGEMEMKLTMETQAKWLHAIKPLHWAVTFRVPMSQVTFMYFGGNLMYVPYTHALTPELRLTGNYQHLISPPVEYKTRDIEELMFYHNIVVRPNTKLFANVLHCPPSTEKYSDSTFDNGFDSSYFLSAVLWYTWGKDAIAKPVGEANILAFAKRLMGSLFW